MSRIRKIDCNPKSGKNFYLVDANFLANKYISPDYIQDPKQKSKVEKCLEWWKEIDRQLQKHKARVFIPDICIAEAFKTLAKKYYGDHWFTTSQQLNNAKLRLAKDIVTTARTLRAQNRVIKYHDISTSRDIIISVDRFYEKFMKAGLLKVSLPDLILLATAKYLMDFFDVPKNCLHIVTLDNPLRKGLEKISELPRGYDPTMASHSFAKIFQ